MLSVALALTCLACAGNGRRMKATEHMQDGLSEQHTASLEEKEENARANPVIVLAVLLAGFSTTAEGFSIPNAAWPNVHGRRLVVNDPTGVRTAVPWDWNRDANDKEGMYWDWKRLFPQLSKFVELPLPFRKTDVTRLSPGDSFGHLQLLPVDDTMVGGASASTFDDHSRRWKGELASFSSGGAVFGFVSIGAKTLTPLDLTGTSGVELKLRSDGEERHFTFILRESNKAWEGGFAVGSPNAQLVKNNQLEPAFELLRIPYSAFTPMLFAPTATETDVKIDLTNIMAVQFALVCDLDLCYPEGAFQLDVLDVGTY